MIDISKPHQTRSGRKVFDLELLDAPMFWSGSAVAFLGGRVMNKEGRGDYYRWTSEGVSTFDSQLDLIRVPEKRMKETAVTADLAKKAMEHNMKIDEQSLLDSARAHVRDAQRICNEIGFMFDTLVYQARYEDKLIRMDRKYRTRGLGGPGKIVRLICTDGPGNYPVVGFVHDETDVYRWNAVGGHSHAASRELSAYDLVPVEDAP